MLNYLNFKLAKERNDFVIRYILCVLYCIFLVSGEVRLCFCHYIVSRSHEAIQGFKGCFRRIRQSMAITAAFNVGRY